MTTPLEHRMAFKGQRTSAALLFSATENLGHAPGEKTYALSWDDGTCGRLTSRQWDRFRPVHAGFALIHGKRDRQALAGLHGEKRAKVAAFLEERAGRLMGPDLMRWYRHGFAPSEARS